MGAELGRLDWGSRADVSAFLGNSLLSAMSPSTAVGLDEAFWDGFPTYCDDALASAVEGCREAACRVRKEAERQGRDAVELCAVEFARLFVGPPSPAVAPWESVCRFGAACGFGDATFDMRRRLRDAGLEMGADRRQYEDHLGIELLYLSVLCRRAADAASQQDPSAHGGDADEIASAIERYVDERPGAWAATFADRVTQEAPDGYYAALSRLAAAFLSSWGCFRPSAQGVDSAETVRPVEGLNA